MTGCPLHGEANNSNCSACRELESRPERVMWSKDVCWGGLVELRRG